MKRGLRKMMLVGAGAAAAGVGLWGALRPRTLTWGATVDEVVRPLPGDDLVANPLYVTTRAITVKAPAAAVWPWLVQLGQNRGGFYTYDALENLMGLDIHSADAVRPEWQDLHAGEDYVTLDPDDYMKMTIAVLEPERAFVVRSGAPGKPPQAPGSFFKGEIECSWAFVLDSVDERTTRLIIRWRAAWADTLATRLTKPVLLEPLHFVMEERTLRGIRDRAERAARLTLYGTGTRSSIHRSASPAGRSSSCCRAARPGLPTTRPSSSTSDPASASPPGTSSGSRRGPSRMCSAARPTGSWPGCASSSDRKAGVRLGSSGADRDQAPGVAQVRRPGHAHEDPAALLEARQRRDQRAGRIAQLPVGQRPVGLLACEHDEDRKALIVREQ